MEIGRFEVDNLKQLIFIVMNTTHVAASEKRDHFGKLLIFFLLVSGSWVFPLPSC